MGIDNFSSRYDSLQYYMYLQELSYTLSDDKLYIK